MFLYAYHSSGELPVYIFFCFFNLGDLSIYQSVKGFFNINLFILIGVKVFIFLVLILSRLW